MARSASLCARCRCCTPPRGVSPSGSIPEDGKKVGELTESRSRVRDLVATLVMVHGGEAISAPWLGLQPSFLISGTSPTIFLSAHALVDLLPTIPSLSVRTELPLTILHALHRTILLCNVVPKVVAGHASPAVATSPYTLLLTAFIMPNGGPFFANLFSLLRPTPMQVSTPPELLPYGWTATDLWAAPLVTGLYATLTHCPTILCPPSRAPLLFPLAPRARVSFGCVCKERWTLDSEGGYPARYPHRTGCVCYCALRTSR
ncbi:hypothetical protein EDB92DRAFT_77653 [Lactarius akahatsu]|uniref:Uncharacterized protein n=1 Tax=Lactarius akahatsu TaxID=416441 RepID=A0AAD4QI70_9AGAM|nr:hypothetical protein EDB92DRAFT_77653 [Lactarius akahatsu]